MKTESGNNMSFQGVVFDFNGTLFWDTPLHNQAWDLFLKKHQIELTDQEKNERIHGKSSADIFKGLFGRTLPPEELEQYVDEKETIYRDLCIKTGKGLAPGAIQLFEDLQNLEVAFTIATASGPDNINFFFEYFQLDLWFNFSKVVFDDGTLRGKPQPDFFSAAMQKLNLQPEKCVVFEDSLAGIASAENAHAGKVIIVNSIAGDYSSFSHQVITDFGQVNRALFRK